MIKKILITTCLFLISIPLAKAHTADDLCPPGDFFAGKGCQPKLDYACFNDSQLYAIWREYWHVRRGLNAKIVEYAGEVAIKRSQKKKKCKVDEGLLHYWEVIPAVQMENFCTIYRQCKPSDYGCRLWMLNSMQEAIKAGIIGRDVWAPREIHNMKACRK